MWWIAPLLASCLVVQGLSDNGVCGPPNTNQACNFGAVPGRTAYYDPNNNEAVYMHNAYSLDSCDAGSSASVKLFTYPGGNLVADCGCLQFKGSMPANVPCSGVTRGGIPAGGYIFRVNAVDSRDLYSIIFTVTHQQATVTAGTVTSTNIIPETATVTSTSTTTDTLVDFSTQTTVTRPASSTTVTVVSSQKATTVLSTSTRSRTRTRHTETYITGTLTTTPKCTASQGQQLPPVAGRNPMRIVKRADDPYYQFYGHDQGDGPLTTTVTPTVYTASTSTTTTTDIDLVNVFTAVTSPNPTPTVTVYTGVDIVSVTTTSYRSTKTKIDYVNSYTTKTVTYTFDRRAIKTAACTA